MKKVIIVVSFFYIAAAVSAEDQRIITVLDFETSGVSKQEMTLFVDYISSNISDYSDYILIDRRQRELILAEAEFSNSGCADESCAIEIGQVLSANQMIVGSLGSIGSRYLLNIKLIEVKTGKTVNDVSDKFNSIEELVDGAEAVVAELLSTMNDSAAELSSENPADIIVPSDDEKNKESASNFNEVLPVEKQTGFWRGIYYTYNETDYNRSKYNLLSDLILQEMPANQDAIKLHKEFNSEYRSGNSMLWGGLIGYFAAFGIGTAITLTSDPINMDYMYWGVGIGSIGFIIEMIGAGKITNSINTLDKLIFKYNNYVHSVNPGVNN